MAPQISPKAGYVHMCLRMLNLHATKSLAG